MNALLEHILSRRTFIAMLYTALLLIGAAVITQIPLELSPEVEYPRFSISTSYQGAPPEVVEATVTSRVEEAVQRLNGIRSVSSTSYEGRSDVRVELQPSAVIDYVLLELNESLALLDEELPREVSYPRINRYVPRELRDLQGFIVLTVTGPGTINDVRPVVDRHFYHRILAVPGVSDVEIRGGTERTVSIEVDPSLMRAYGIHIGDVQRSLGEFSRRLAGNMTSAGVIREGEMRIPLIVETSPTGIEDIGNAVVRATHDARIVHLRDIATVSVIHEPPRTYWRVNGLSAVSVTIEREPGSNIIRTADAVYRAIGEIESSLPPGYDVRMQVDRSDAVRDELATLSNRAALALAFVLIVLVLTLGSVRAPLYVLSTILFSVFITLIGFYFAGLSVNVLTLAGLTLAFGMLVDNSIVVFDSIERSVRRADRYREALVDGAAKVFLPVLAATGTTIVAFLPFVLLSEELRPFFMQFASALVLSLAASLFVSFTLIPLLAYRFPIIISENTGTRNLQNFMRSGYESLLRIALRRKAIVIAVSILIIGIPVWLLPDRLDDGLSAGGQSPVSVDEPDESEPGLLKRSGVSIYNSIFDSDAYRSVRPYIDHAFGGATHLFFKYVNRGEVWQWGADTYLIVRISMPQGTEIGRLNEIILELEDRLTPFANMLNYYETNIYSTDEGQIRIEFPPAVQMQSFPHVLKGYLTSYAAQIGGASAGVYGYGPGFFSGGSAAPSFNIRLLGYNYYRLQELAAELGERLKENRRIANVEINRTFGRRDNLFEAAATVDRSVLLRYGLTVDEVFRELRLRTRESVAGGQWFLDGEDVRYTVRYIGHDEFSLDDLFSRPVEYSGGIYKLGDVLHIHERRTPARIDRENQQYRRSVSFEYRGPYRFGREYLDQVKAEFEMPYGYSIIDDMWWFTMRREQERELWSILLLSALFVFMVTASLYESMKKPLVVMITVPFAVAGVFLAFYFAGAQFDRGGYAAIALLAGISINNSILLVDAMARNQSSADSSVSVIEAIIAGASSRVRAVTITTLTTIAGLTPLLMEKETAQFWYGLGLGTIGGLAASYVFVLILCPIVYAVVVGKGKRIEEAI
jgi:multidrug efflux pump subunit AcrB